MKGRASITIEVKITPRVVTTGASATPADRARRTAATPNQKTAPTTQSGTSGGAGLVRAVGTPVVMIDRSGGARDGPRHQHRGRDEGRGEPLAARRRQPDEALRDEPGAEPVGPTHRGGGGSHALSAHGAHCGNPRAQPKKV